MLSGFRKVRFHVVDKDVEELRAAGTRPLAHRGVGRPRELDEGSVQFNNDEAAARYFISKVFQQDERPGVRGLTAPDRAELVPDMRLTGVQEVPLTNTRLVRFDQTLSSIPVFGSRVVVELDQNRELVGLVGELAEIEEVSPIAALSPADALKRIAELAEVDVRSLEAVQPPELNFFHDEKHETWHLAYFFKEVDAAPESFLESALDCESHGHGMGRSPRQIHPRLNYLVDAHDGTVLLYYSATPLLDIPSKCHGVGEGGSIYEFWGRQAAEGFEMSDPLRAVKTYDQRLADVMAPLPTGPVQNVTNDWAGGNRAAVSAHVNATRVYDFYKSVLMRDGIDDKGMDLASVVNCTYSDDEPPPEWHNAVWYQNRMWYGQVKEHDGTLRSYSRFLDIIAHELTHGVTQYTSDLVYRYQSGALNESFSDIFGVIINNWYVVGPDSDVEQWNWEIGPDLGPNGLPLRDMSDPTRTDDPDHMDDYLVTSADSGGVHTNSNIHNKAAYNVLTVRDEQGQHVFTSREVAVLYYLCLSRLNSWAKFSDALEELVNVVTTYFAGDPDREQKIGYIRDAYARVGIA